MNRLKEIRRLKGMTQYELVMAIRLYQTRIFQWERGYYIPRKSEKEALAEALKVSVKDIFPNE